MKAIVTQGPKDAQIVSDRPEPQLRPGYLLVKPVALALNPTDWKHVDFMASKGALVGCDYAGIVIAAGDDLAKEWPKGTRIAGVAHGGNAVQHEDGAFAETIAVKAAVAIRIPDNVGFEEAATLGIGVTTCGQAMYQSLKLPMPDQPGKEAFPILIYGGSTATGALAIQYAKLSGLVVIATASKKNHEFVKSLGADAVFDYNGADCGAQINAHTKNALKYAMDCISEGNSADICADALSTDGGTYTALLPVKFPRGDVESKMTLAYTAFGEDFEFAGQKHQASPEDQKFAHDFWNLTAKLMADGKIKSHKVDVRKGGWQGILDGLQEMREGKVSASKLVYRVDQ